MRWVRDLTGLYDFIALVVLDAPDDFPVQDYRAADQQLDLDRAFDELRAGLEFVAKREDDPDFHDRLHVALDGSLAAYRSGERVVGARLLQAFQDMIFKATN
jgi:hypothetical protein